MSEYQHPLTAHGLVNATAFGKIDQVKKIIESGVNPDDYTGHSQPAIIFASAYGNYEIVEYLLSKGGNPNNYTHDKLSALKSAADIGNLKIVKLLLKFGADPNYERNGNVALTLACDSVHQGINKELIELLLPITDKKYYQRAYEYCTDIEMRNMIKDLAQEITFTDPVDGYGGPKYKEKQHYETPPTNPLIRQCWELVGMYIDTFGKDDPNRAFWMILVRCGLSDSGDDGTVQLARDDKNQLKRLFEGDNPKASKDEYAEIYKILETDDPEPKYESDGD